MLHLAEGNIKKNLCSSINGRPNIWPDKSMPTPIIKIWTNIGWFSQFGCKCYNVAFNYPHGNIGNSSNLLRVLVILLHALGTYFFMGDCGPMVIFEYYKMGPYLIVPPRVTPGCRLKIKVWFFGHENFWS